MSHDLYVRNAVIATADGIFEGGLTVQDGRITGLVSGSPELVAKDVIDVGGKWVLPGIVDAHVHFHAPGRDDWEGYACGSAAAAAGGVTTVADMPLNGIPPTTDRDSLLVKRGGVSREAVVDYGHWAGLVDNNLEAMDGLHQEGVVGFKAFMSGAATPEFKRVDDDVLYAGMLKAHALGSLVAVHAENEYLIRLFEGQLKAQGRVEPAAWLESRPPAVEVEAIQRVLYWSQLTGCRVHIVHVSAAEGFRAVARAKTNGIKASIETCPHFLFFDQQAYLEIGAEAKSDPPVRTRPEVEDLWACVLNGLVDNIASDHAPSTTQEKLKGNQDIFSSWAGITGIQTMLPVLLSEGVHRRGLALPDLVRMTSANPARMLGLYPQKGSLLPGSDADLVIVDPHKEWTLHAADLLSKNQHSPYVGARLRGAVERTLVRGATVFQDGQVRAAPGYGQLVCRKPGTL